MSQRESSATPQPLNCDRDPARWAREFNDVLEANDGHRLDEGWLISWFANAIMCGEDTYRWRQEAALKAKAALQSETGTPPTIKMPAMFSDAVLEVEAPIYAAPLAVAQSVRAPGKSAVTEDTGGRGFESHRPEVAAPQSASAEPSLYHEFLKHEYEKPLPMELAKRIAEALRPPSSIAASIPNGWKIEKDGAAIILHSAGSATYVVHPDDGDTTAHEALYALVEALLAEPAISSATAAPRHLPGEAPDLWDRHWVYSVAEAHRPLIAKMTTIYGHTGSLHLLYMLDEIASGKMSPTKACRWLGWMQAAIHRDGKATLAELKAINKNASLDSRSDNDG